MELSDDELDMVHEVLYEEAHYGDDDTVYGDGDRSILLRQTLRKVTDEAKRRGFWWAQ